ncbi:MAG: HAMP domain-containing protein, partial [Gammaproteobacteria bacterium]
MNRLFWRIFFAFWSVIIVAALLGGLLSALIMREKLADTRFETLSRVLPALAAEAQSALRAGGETGLADWLASRQQDSPGMLLVLRADGSELLGRPLPPWFQRRLQRGGAGPPGLTGRPPPAVTLQGPAGQRYRLVLLPPRPPRGGLFAAPPSRALFLLLLLAGSVVACYLLARYLVRPVLALRAAGRRIAAGDLAARLDPRSLARRDEIGALARDFNRMAERIQRLVEGQQQLLRDVSHELRSPLARMELAVGLLERQGAQATPDTLERVRCEVRRLDELIGRLLAYSRLLGGGEAQRTAVPLAELARAAVADADYEAQAAGRCVQLDLRAEPVIDGDAR